MAEIEQSDRVESAEFLKKALLRKVKESNETSMSFFVENQEKIQQLASSMAERFSAGGKLYVIGNGGSACDAEHVSVEFMHPIFDKRKPLPCVSLTTGGAMISAIANDLDFSRVFAMQVEQLVTRHDMVLAITTSGMSANLVAAIREAKEIGAMTIAFAGKDGGRLKDLADQVLVVRSYAIHRIQEVHVMLLHILWDLIHVTMGANDVV